MVGADPARSLEEEERMNGKTIAALAALALGALALADPALAQEARRVDARAEAAVRPSPEAPRALRLSGRIGFGPEGIQVVFDGVDDEHPFGDPIPGAAVSLDLNVRGRTVATTEAGSDGRFVFENVRPGTYTVVATLRVESPAVVITEEGTAQ